MCSGFRRFNRGGITGSLWLFISETIMVTFVILCNFQFPGISPSVKCLPLQLCRNFFSILFLVERICLVKQFDERHEPHILTCLSLHRAVTHLTLNRVVSLLESLLNLMKPSANSLAFSQSLATGILSFSNSFK